MTPAESLAFIKRHGIVLESAQVVGTRNLADAFLGARRPGSWWGHSKGKQFFAITRRIRRHPEVLVCRLIGGKVTYVHRRLWPALIRLRDTIGPRRLAAIREVHGDSGAHHVVTTPLSRWAPPTLDRKSVV